MTVLVTPDGTAASTPVELPPGATVADLLSAVAPDCPPAAFRVRVNRRPAGSDQTLRVGDRVSVTPVGPPDQG